MKNKTKISIIFLVIALTAGVYLVDQYKNKNELSLISGEVTRIEGDKIYFQATVLTAAENQEVQAVKEDKVAVVLPTTEFIRRDPLSGSDVEINSQDIKVGDQITIRYLRITKTGEIVAIAIEPALSDEKYRVDNLIKYFNQ